MYNTRRWVRRAVESALAQTCGAVDVVVVDDGSTDGGAKEIAALAREGDVTLLRQPHRGVAAARNAGWRAATADLLVFLDSDDFVEPRLVEKLQPLVDAADARSFAYCDFRRVDARGAVLAVQTPVAASRTTREGNLLPALVFRGYFQLNGALLQRGLVAALDGFDEGFAVCEDFHFWLRAAAEGARARYLDEPLAYYTQRPGSLSADGGRMAAAATAALRDVATRYPRQLSAAAAAAQREYAAINQRVWEDGQAHLRAAAEHVHGLEAALAQIEAEIAALRSRPSTLAGGFAWRPW